MFILKLKLTNLFIMDTIYLRMTIILKNFLHLITNYIENNYSKIIVIQKFNSQILRIFTIYYFKNILFKIYYLKICTNMNIIS